MCTASLPAPQHPTTSRWPLKYPPPQCRRGHCIESRAKSRWQKGTWCLSLAECMLLWFLDLTNWCKQLQHAAWPTTLIMHYTSGRPNLPGMWVTFSWKGTAMPMLGCMTWQICRQPEQNNWLCPLKVDQHYASLLCSQGAVCWAALARGWLRNSILLTSTELTFFF